MHPLAGAWTANIAKSRRHPNHLFQSSTMRFDVSENVVVLAYAGVNMAGKQESATQTLQVDGVEYPIAQAPGVISRCRWIGSRTLETIGKKDGVVLGQRRASGVERARRGARLRNPQRSEVASARQAGGPADSARTERSEGRRASGVE